MRIGLTYTGSPEKHENYARWLRGGEEAASGTRPSSGAGYSSEAEASSGACDVVEVIRLSAEDDNLSAVDTCDGLVLSGGIDIHPSFYGGASDYSPGLSKGPVKWNLERDRFEIAALHRAWQQGKPVLGVCRGLQLINIVCGGSLIQDLGEQGDEIHQINVADNEDLARPTDKEHGVKVEEGTLLYDITGKGGHINSAHHQAIDTLGTGLKANCRADDGVIEGLEWASPATRPFMLAVQWHPERMFTNGFPGRELYMNIRNRFIEEIKKTINQ